MIEVKGLTKTFRRKSGENLVAVDNLSFQVNKGEIVSLLGVNGAGKTTTMRMLSTVLRPTSGTATLEGCDIRTQPGEVRRRLGFLSGDTGLYPRLKAREVITYFGRLYDVPDATIARRITELAEFLDMGEFLDRKVDFLSTGMKQKVSIARSIIHDPPVMIFDEPTAGLDILTAANIVGFIRKCREEGKCVVFSTHIMREAERIADRIVVIHRGRLLAEGTLEALRDDTGMTDLDDIFIEFVNRMKDEGEKVVGDEY
ncbi:MAG: ATP-binding cassette domain-containing protein [Candidatus Cloacimonetes bacterium]|nr:ATP-binding cassette domain-containing protein [Candidatus Cloacimonadota bacterium]